MKILSVKVGDPDLAGVRAVTAYTEGGDKYSCHVWIERDNSLSDRVGTYPAGSDQEAEIHDAFTSGRYAL